MKLAIIILLLLLVSIVLLGCVREQVPSGLAGEEIPKLEEQSFENESAAFNALEKELAGIEDISPDELEKALQE